MNNEKDDYELKRAWNTFSFEFQKILVETQIKTDKLFIKIFKHFNELQVFKKTAGIYIKNKNSLVFVENKDFEELIDKINNLSVKEQ